MKENVCTWQVYSEHMRYIWRGIVRRVGLVVKQHSQQSVSFLTCASAHLVYIATCSYGGCCISLLAVWCRTPRWLDTNACKVLPSMQ